MSESSERRARILEKLAKVLKARPGMSVAVAVALLLSNEGRDRVGPCDDDALEKTLDKAIYAMQTGGTGESGAV